MIIRRNLLTVVAVAGAISAFAFVGSTGAQNAQPPAPARIAIANPVKIFNEMQETKDLKVKLESDGKALEETGRRKRAALDELNGQLRLLKPSAPEYAQKNRELTQAAIEFQAWGQISQQEYQNSQKDQTKVLFDKIQLATAELASERGYDLVLADQRPEFPENMAQLNLEQLQQIISRRNVLYATETVDLSTLVTARLDQKYKK